MSQKIFIFNYTKCVVRKMSKKIVNVMDRCDNAVLV